MKVDTCTWCCLTGWKPWRWTCCLEVQVWTEALVAAPPPPLQFPHRLSLHGHTGTSRVPYYLLQQHHSFKNQMWKYSVYHKCEKKVSKVNVITDNLLYFVFIWQKGPIFRENSRDISRCIRLNNYELILLWKQVTVASRWCINPTLLVHSGV